jgi:hypothetical protein
MSKIDIFLFGFEFKTEKLKTSRDNYSKPSKLIQLKKKYSKEKAFRP